MEELKNEPIEQGIHDYFTEIYKKEKEDFSIDVDLLLMDLPKPSWENIEAEADRIIKEEFAGEAETEDIIESKRISIKPKKKLMVAILAATIGTLMFASIANGDRMYRYIVSQEWRSGENDLMVDSEKIISRSEMPYEEIHKIIFKETGVQSIKPMDPSWNLISYEIEGKHSYITYKKDEIELHIKQRSYQNDEISITRTTDKEIVGEESNDFFPNIKFPIYYEKTKKGESYETIFTIDNTVYVIRGTCTEKDIRDFIKDLYIKNTMN